MVCTLEFVFPTFSSLKTSSFNGIEICKKSEMHIWRKRGRNWSTDMFSDKRLTLPGIGFYTWEIYSNFPCINNTCQS